MNPAHAEIEHELDRLAHRFGARQRFSHEEDYGAWLNDLTLDTAERLGVEHRGPDQAALDDLADLLRLPQWQIRGSAADFIEAINDVVSQVRDIDARASRALLAATGYTEEDYLS